MFLTRRFYIVMTAIILLFVAGFWFRFCYGVAVWALVLMVVLLVIDLVLLYSKRGLEASRVCAERFSNGDENKVEIRLESSYSFPVKLNVIDEIPFVFQRRDLNFALKVRKNEGKIITYHLRPTKRGVYGFGKIRVFASSPIGLVQRRFTCGEEQDIKVYPSYLMLNQYELLAISNNLTELGIKKIRRIGNNTEFEQIKDYVQGDEYRAINWKASARRNQLMVNVYQDERSQQIFNLIDKGRVMQQAFNGMTLLDYAINASLVLSYVAVRKEDKAGLMTFNEDLDEFLQAAKSSTQMQNILETLYAQETDFGETDYSALLINANRLIRKRSLLVLYTNFSGLNSLQRQLPYLRQLNQRHRLLVVFFADEEINDFINQKPLDSEEYYQQVIAEKISREKQLIVTTLQQQGILSLLTTPDRLSINVINRYLEIKSRQMI